jgi:hypothetical protein
MRMIFFECSSGDDSSGDDEMAIGISGGNHDGSATAGPAASVQARS